MAYEIEDIPFDEEKEPIKTIEQPKTNDVRELTDVIVSLWRNRNIYLRAYQRLDLQCQAIIRREFDGDKAKAGKVWAKIKRNEWEENPLLIQILEPLRIAMVPLEESKEAYEKDLKQLAKQHPLYEFVTSVRGLSDISFVSIIGEAGRPITDYRSVAAFWKRMGVAVIDGERQRKHTNELLAIKHGYSPQRRSYSYVIQENMLKAQKPDDEYRQVYDNYKTLQQEKYPENKPIVAHKRAMRYMVKRLLKHIWIEAKRISNE